MKSPHPSPFPAARPCCHLPAYHRNREFCFNQTVEPWYAYVLRRKQIIHRNLFLNHIVIAIVDDAICRYQNEMNTAIIL